MNLNILHILGEYKFIEKSKKKLNKKEEEEFNGQDGQWHELGGHNK